MVFTQAEDLEISVEKAQAMKQSLIGGILRSSNTVTSGEVAAALSGVGLFENPSDAQPTAEAMHGARFPVSDSHDIIFAYEEGQGVLYKVSCVQR